MLKVIIASIFLFLGCVSSLISLLGVIKFKFVMNRMHAAAIIDATCLFLILIGLAILVWDINYVPKLLIVLAFQWITSPIASHMVARLEVESDKTASEHMDREVRN